MNAGLLIKTCRYATARGYARRAAQSTTVIFLQPVIYFGRAFPNWRARVIPAIVISGFLAFVSKNPICFSDGSMSNEELTRIREAIDVRDLGESCVKVSGDKTVAKVLYALEDKICNG